MLSLPARHSVKLSLLLYHIGEQDIECRRKSLIILVLKSGKYRDKVINILAVVCQFHFAQFCTQSFISNNSPKDTSFENYKANPIEKLLINFLTRF